VAQIGLMAVGAGRSVDMIEDARGRIDYEARGAGPTVVLVPGSCSTGAAWRPVMAAWRPVMAAWGDRFRCVTTSLLGYGGTAERRSASDPSIWHEVDVVESVIRKAGGPVHLVGHSFGGLVAIAVALRHRVPLASLAVIEAPAAELLRDSGDRLHYRAIRQMTDVYFAAFANGDVEAISTMIDFYGGAGTFASWPLNVRAYAQETTAVNMLDWASAYGFPLSAAALASIDIPVLVLWGQLSHPAVQRANALLAACIIGAVAIEIKTAAHFMIATHADEVSRLITRHAQGAQARPMTAAAESAV
jgi:pimeloyl-ACP methyl ester carboxylesterase